MLYSEKTKYHRLFQLLSPRYDQDVFLWGEDLIEKQLCIYPHKIKELPGYDTFAHRLVNCGLILINLSAGRKMTCYPARYDEQAGRIYIAEKNFSAWWPLLKRSIGLGIRLARQNGIKCRVHAPEEVVSLQYLERPGSNPILKNDRIIYKAKGFSKEEQQLMAMRQSALDNPKNIYFYSKTDGSVHDRLCEEVKKIRLEDFVGSDQFPEGREYCPRCGRQIFIRIGCAPSAKEIPVCSRIFLQYGVNTSQIRRFVMEYGMRFHAKSLSEMRIRCGEDNWVIQMDDGRLELLHNNYLRISPTERYITEGFHHQKLNRHASMHQMLVYIARYSWQKHLAAENIGKNTAIQEAVPEFALDTETFRKKEAVWRRLAAYIKGLLHL